MRIIRLFVAGVLLSWGVTLAIYAQHDDGDKQDKGKGQRAEQPKEQQRPHIRLSRGSSPCFHRLEVTHKSTHAQRALG